MEEFHQRYIKGNEPLPPEWTELNSWGELKHISVMYKGVDLLNPIVIKDYIANAHKKPIVYVSKFKLDYYFDSSSDDDD